MERWSAQKEDGEKKEGASIVCGPSKAWEEPVPFPLLSEHRRVLSNDFSGPMRCRILF